MATFKQITAFLENKPGRLAQVLSELAHAKVNVIALAVMDRDEQRVLRIVTEDAVATIEAVQTLNVQYSQNDVLAVELRNHPGALAHVCETLAAERVNIDYAYCSSGGRNGKAYGIFKVSNLEKAQRVLAEAPSNRRSERRVLRDQRVYKK